MISFDKNTVIPRRTDIHNKVILFITVWFIFVILVSDSKKKFSFLDQTVLTIISSSIQLLVESNYDDNSNNDNDTYKTQQQ